MSEPSPLRYLKVMPKCVSSDPPQTYQLSAEQFKFYDDFGYLVIKELIDFSTLYACKQRFIQIAKGIVDKGNITVMKEISLLNSGATGEKLLNKLQEIAYDEVFSTYIEHPRLLHVVSQLIGTNITAVHNMFINKPPGSGRHPSHQDLYYFPFRPADRITAAWTAIDHVTSQNGCLYVVPGSHKQGELYPHGHIPNTNKLFHGILEEDTVAPAPSRTLLEMDPGDTVLFHPLLVHGSGANVSQNYRKSISCHYADSACRYVEVARSPHAAVAREVEAVGRRRGFDISYVETWRYKSKQVMGVRSNL